MPARRPPRDRWLFPIHPDDLPDEEAGGLTGGVVGHVGRRMRPTWGIDGWEVAKHGRILSSDRVPRAFARQQTRAKRLICRFSHPMFSSKAARRRTARARSARFPRRRYRLPRGIIPRRSAIPCPEALARGMQTSALPVAQKRRRVDPARAQGWAFSARFARGFRSRIGPRGGAGGPSGLSGRLV